MVTFIHSLGLREKEEAIKGMLLWLKCCPDSKHSSLEAVALCVRIVCVQTAVFAGPALCESNSFIIKFRVDVNSGPTWTNERLSTSRLQNQSTKPYLQDRIKIRL
jgi:hypothetical protein